MHIKQVFIKGFKSFKDQSSFEPFSPGHNVIVGRNGSGKSNFFQAIQFVLSDLYTNMRSEERQHLIFDAGGSAGDTIMQAYVEIVFDNKDGRFPIDKEEVVLRRSIGLKKDEYYLDKKHVTKHDVINLLESAGFSRSNPYYIVQQGRVNSIALMKDTERMELLKEVAGTRVYDERRAESEKIMQESTTKKKQAEELLIYIDERLKELEDEKEELREYQVLDKDRRSLEFTIYDAELKQAVSKIAELEARRAEETARVDELHNRAAELHEQVKQAEKELKHLTNDLLQFQKEKERLDEERADFLQEKARLQLNVDDTKSRIAEKQKQRKDMEAELARVKKEITKDEAALEKAKKGAEDASSRENDLKTELANTERRVQELYAKQGRKAQFKSAAERDRFLDSEITGLKKASATSDAQAKELEADIKKLKTELARDLKVVEDADLDGARAQYEDAVRAANDLRAKRDDLANQRKDLWRKDAALEEDLKRANDDKGKLDRQLANTVAKQISAGLAAVRRITEENNIEGVYGPLIELCEVPERFMTAVEITAGNALFYVVVDTDATAARILEHLSSDKSGRVSFMPLNRLAPKEVPEVDTTEAIPMIKNIKYNRMYHKAFLQIFGKTFICRDLDVATKISSQYNLNCITLDGDQVNKSGGITGGFYDRRASRLVAMASIKELQKRIDSLNKDLSKVRVAAQKIDQEITSTLAQIEKQESTREQLKNTIEQLQLDIRAARVRIEGNNAALEGKNRQLGEVRNTYQQTEATIKSLAAEKGTPLVDKLNSKEAKELSELTSSVTDMQKRLVELASEAAGALAKRAELENVLTNNLRKKLAQLENDIANVVLSIGEGEARREQAQRELDAVSDNDKTTTSRHKELDASIDAARAKITEQKAKADDLKGQETDVLKQIQNENKNAEKNLNKRSAMLQQRDEAMRKIRELGPLPAEAPEKHAGEDHKELLKQLHKINEKLKKYSHVNKKALDQFVHFTEQREALVKRKEELDESENHIRDLITVLDQRKDEAIERTFKGVARHFTEVFQELVPNGKASLVMQRKRNADDDDGEEGGQPGIRNYSGVAIRVSFNQQTEESRLIQQLSGGQKSLVALAFIFAIQRCDRAPFYLFDEIDAALDPVYRAAVGRLIKKESEGTPNVQFITVTFKPELLQSADRFYVVRLDPRTKESGIEPLESKADAIDLLEEEERGAAAH